MYVDRHKILKKDITVLSGQHVVIGWVLIPPVVESLPQENLWNFILKSSLAHENDMSI